MNRIIGIRHRRKKTREGEARPTMVAIKSHLGVVNYTLDDDTAELDFLMGRFPIAWRDVFPNEDIHGLRFHQCKWRKVKVGESISRLNPNHLRKTDTGQEIITKVPINFDGLGTGDYVAMVLGGSGDRFAAALSRKGEDIGAKVFRIPPFSLSANRNGSDKEKDPETLISLLATQPNFFYQVRRRDRELIRVKESLAARQSAQKDRIACEQRILQSLVGKIFLNEDGYFPEGVIEDQFDTAKDNDVILQALLREEKRRDRELADALKSVEVWKNRQ